jgi:hypothetical protein
MWPEGDTFEVLGAGPSVQSGANVLTYEYRWRLPEFDPIRTSSARGCYISGNIRETR